MCVRNYLIFEKDNHKYYYNPNKLISDTLRKKLFNHLYTISKKRLNKKTKQSDIIINDIVAPDDNDDYFNLQKNISKPARELKRKILTKKVQQFIRRNADDFEQDENSIQIIYEVKADGKQFDLNTKAFKVVGGKYKTRKAIDNHLYKTADDLINTYELDDIESIIIKRIYINDIEKATTGFRDIKMYGTLLNICGYDLQVGKYEFVNACAVEHHVKMFNTIRKGWTIQRFMDEIGMKTIDEGVGLTQLTPLYEKYKIGYHVVDFKYHSTASHHDHNYKPQTHIPHLFYMINNNHLYPIAKSENKKSISQMTRKQQKTYTHKEFKPDKRNVHTFHRPTEILAMLGFANPDGYNTFDLKNMKDDIFVCETPTVVHDLFYELLHHNMLYNKNARTDGIRVIQFNINNMTIQENTRYKEVIATIDVLNQNIASTDEQYFYHGQSIHRLAFEYYERNYNKNYQSEMSPQIANIFDDTLSKNTSFNITLKDVEAEVAYDFNKLYASILKCCGDDFGWCQFMPTDYVSEYDKKITIGFY